MSTIPSSSNPNVATGSNSSNNSNNLKAKVEDTLSGYNSGDEHVGQKDAQLSPDEWQKRDDAFIKIMSDRGFVIKDMVEDGACLFRAISMQIFGDQDMHELIRQQTMDYIVCFIIIFKVKIEVGLTNAKIFYSTKIVNILHNS